jgi:hypothetical protein
VEIEKKNKPVVMLGRDIGMEEVGNFSLRGLVGRFGYWAMGEKIFMLGLRTTGVHC